MTSKNINKVREFFKNNGSCKWKTFITCSRCEGFTLSHGFFCKFDFKISDEDYDNDIVFEKCNEFKKQYPNLNFYRLPCCWPKESGVDLFIGFNVYPLLWTERRHFINNYNLESAMDDFYTSPENKKLILQKYENYKQYVAPLFLETEYIYETYTEQKNWKDCLYLNNYEKIISWGPMLDSLFESTILSCTASIRDFCNENKIDVPECKWCFLPSDCASCS
jgi:hypothetical protein